MCCSVRNTAAEGPVHSRDWRVGFESIDKVTGLRSEVDLGNYGRLDLGSTSYNGFLLFGGDRIVMTVE